MPSFVGDEAASDFIKFPEEVIERNLLFDSSFPQFDQQLFDFHLGERFEWFVGYYLAVVMEILRIDRLVLVYIDLPYEIQQLLLVMLFKIFGLQPTCQFGYWYRHWKRWLAWI